MTIHGSRSVELKAVAAAAVGSISVGFVPLFVTGLQTAGVDTLSTLLWRYIVALAILVPLALRYHDLVHDWNLGGKWLVLNAATLGALQVFSYFKSVETLPTSVAVTVFYCYPVLALILDRVLFRISPSIETLAAIALIIVGVALTSFPGLMQAKLDPLGLFYATLSAVGYAVYIAAAYHITRTLPPLSCAVFIYGTFGLVFGVAALFTGFAVPSSPELWLNVLFIGTLGGALQILSFAYALPRLASTGYAVIVCLELVTVVLVGVALLGEELQTVQWLGICLVVAGVLARFRRPRRKDG